MTQQYPPSGRQFGKQDWAVFVGGLGLSVLVLAFPWWMNRLEHPPESSSQELENRNFLYQKALQTGWEAAVAVQTANGRQDWEKVVHQWEDAIALLKRVESTPQASATDIQAKVAEYQANQAYAMARSQQSSPKFNWESFREIAGGTSFNLVDPDLTDYVSPGPRLEITDNQTIANTDDVNQILASLNLPPVPVNPIAPGNSVQVKRNQYIIKNYPLGELVLYQDLCDDSLLIHDKYPCLRRITVRDPGI